MGVWHLLGHTQRRSSCVDPNLSPDFGAFVICAILLCADVDQSEKSPDDEAFFGKKHFGQVEFPQKGQWFSKFGAFRCRSHDCVVASALKFGVVVLDVCSNLCTKGISCGRMSRLQLVLVVNRRLMFCKVLRSVGLGT